MKLNNQALLTSICIVILLLFTSFNVSIYPKEVIERPNSFSIDSSLDRYSTSSTSFSKNYATLEGHAWEVRKVEFSPNGEMLASSSSDGSIRIWDVETGEIIHVLQNHYYDVASIAFSPDSKLLASGGWEKKINLWDTSTGSLLKSWSIDPHVALDLAFTPDGNSIAIGSADYDGYWSTPHELPLEHSYLRLIDIADGQILKKFTGHTNPVTSVEFSSDGLNLFSSSWDKQIKMWDVSSSSEIHSFINHTEVVTSFGLSPDETKLISGSFDGSIKLWDLDSKTLLETYETVDMEVLSVIFAGSNDLIAAAIGDISFYPSPTTFWLDFGDMKDSAIHLWNIQTGELVETLDEHDHIIESISVSPEGSVLASGSWDWSVKLWGDYPTIQIETPSDDWETSTPTDQGLNSTKLDEIGESATTGVHSILVIRNEKLVFEKYYNDPTHNYKASNKHVLFSATKSFTSALIGIAIDKGFIQSVDQKVLDFFPEYEFENVDNRKEEMTLRHLLTMTSGLQWSETVYSDYIREMYFSNDSVQFVLDRPMVSDPGKYYFYNSGCSHLLSAIIKKTSGLDTLEFALEYLFEPIGIERNDVVWMSDTQGSAYGGIGLFLTPRNLAKFGQLFLNEGIWNGEQVISKSWINESTSDQTEGIPRYVGAFPWTHPLDGYGYQWWTTSSLNAFAAQGHMGKIIIVFPEEELVVVFTSNVSPSTILNIAENILNSVLPIPKRTKFFHVSLILPSLGIIILLKKRKKKFRR